MSTFVQSVQKGGGAHPLTTHAHARGKPVCQVTIRSTYNVQPSVFVCKWGGRTAAGENGFLIYKII